MVNIKYSWHLMHISCSDHSVVFVIRNEEKLEALLAYFPFRRVATSMDRRISVFTTSGSQVRQAVLK